MAISWSTGLWLTKDYKLDYKTVDWLTLSNKMLLNVLILLPLSVLRVGAATGILISGGGNTGSGNYAEMFIPSTGQHCHLPDIPGRVEYSRSEIQMLLMPAMCDVMA